MTRSTLLGCLAGFLLAIEGLHFVLGRFALLDGFLAFWVIAGFACLVVDRDRMRERLVDWYERSLAAPAHRDRAAARHPAVAHRGRGLPRRGVRQQVERDLLPHRLRRAQPHVGRRGAAGGRAAPAVPGHVRLRPAERRGRARAGARDHLRGELDRLVRLPLGYGRNWEQATTAGPVFFVFDSVRSWLSYHFRC